MKEEWLMSGAVVPVDAETTAALVAEIKRLIFKEAQQEFKRAIEAKLKEKTDVVGGMALAQQEQEPCGWQFYQSGKWQNGMETNNHRANTEAAGIPVRDVYPSVQQEPVLITTVGEILHALKLAQDALHMASLPFPVDEVKTQRALKAVDKICKALEPKEKAA